MFLVFHRASVKILGFFLNNGRLFITIVKKGKDSDIIYSLNPSFTGFCSCVAAKILRKPFVIRYVGDAAWETASNTKQTEKFFESFLLSPEGGILIKILLLVQKIVLTKADKIITPSNFLKKMLTTYYQVPAHRISIIHNSIDLDDYKSDGEINNYNSFYPIVLTVSRLIRHKRVDQIVTSMSRVKQRYPKSVLMIVGDGPEKTKLQDLAEELKLQDMVIFFGTIPKKKVVRLMQKANIFILNSVYEGLPHVIIEAMAAKIPVIATNIPGTDELIQNADTGILIPPDSEESLAEKILELSENKELQIQIANNAFSQIERLFTWNKNLYQLEREFEKLA